MRTFAHSLPRAAIEANSHLTLQWSEKGGHVGFVSGPPWKPRYEAEAAIFTFFSASASRSAA